MHFSEEVSSFFKQQHIIVESQHAFLLKSKFPFLYVEAHNLLLHCVSIDRSLLKNTSPGFFAELCDEALGEKIKLVHLWEDTWHNQPSLTQSRLLALCGISTRVHARQSEIK